MKRSELAEYIKETIVDVLSEASSEDVKNQETINQLKKDELALTQKIKDLSEDIDDEDVAAQQATADTKDSVSVIGTVVTPVLNDVLSPSLSDSTSSNVISEPKLKAIQEKVDSLITPVKEIGDDILKNATDTSKTKTLIKL